MDFVPPHNVIDLDSKATVIQVLVYRPFIPHPPSPRKPSKVRKEFPPTTLPGYSWVHEEFQFYEISFQTYESIIDILEFVKLYHIDGLNVMVIETCLASEHVFMHAYLTKTHFMYMYFTLFSNLHLTAPFNKFDIDVLCELNVTPTQLHLNVRAAMCAFRVLCDKFFITPIASKFLHHYNVNINKKRVGFLSLAFPNKLL